MNDEFIKTVIGLRGDIGRKWLSDLPSIIKRYEAKWNLTVFPPFYLSYNYVAPAKTKSGEDVVLKISFPDNEKYFNTEIEALSFFHGDVAIKVLQKDLKNSVVLLERAMPGERLRTVSDEQKQTSIASEVIKKIHKPVTNAMTSEYETIADWVKVFDRYTKGSVPEWIITKAEGMIREFLQDKKEQVLLHGDLHSDNILSSQRGWLVIDPKGVIGEREFELGAYLRNPLYDYPKGSDYKKLEKERIVQFREELGFDKKRLLGWAFICAAMSLLYFLEDQKTVKKIYIDNAEILHTIHF